MNKLKKRILALGLAVVMTLTLIPMVGIFAFAAESSNITVFMTVSLEGELAATAGGSVMGWKPVIVEDTNGDGQYSYDEALVAAHATYKKDGYATTEGQYGLEVTKLWGVETDYNTFFTNGTAISMNVGESYVEDGDFLVACTLADTSYWSDYYTFFNKKALYPKAGEKITLNLQDVPAFGGDTAALSGATIGICTSDGFQSLGTTDENGNVELSFDEPGTYYVSAQGVVKGVSAYDYVNSKTVTVDAPIIAPCCIVTVDEKEFAYAGEDGDVKFINESGKELGMWSLQDGTYSFVAGDEVVVHFVPKNKTTYAGFSGCGIGLINNSLVTDQPELDVEVNSDGSMDMIFSKELCGKAYPVSPIKHEFKVGGKSGGEAPTWTTGEQYYLAIPAAENIMQSTELTVTKQDGLMFNVAKAYLYEDILYVTLGSDSFTKVFVGHAEVAEEAAEEDLIPIVDRKFQITVEDTSEPILLSFYSKKNEIFYNRTFTINRDAKTLYLADYKEPVGDIEKMTVEEALAKKDELATVEMVNSLIRRLKVQEREENTDKFCTVARAYYDALTDEEKEELIDPGYFGDDTGDATKDDPRNQDKIGEKEILVVSFGTSFNDSRVATIKAVEDAIAKAYPDYSVRRAFTAQIIINHIQSRDGEVIDNMEQALDRAVVNKVKELVVQPTHLMHGAEYDEMCEALEAYKDKFDKIIISEPLLNTNDDKTIVAKAVVDAAVKDSKYDSLDAAAADKTAFVFMGHGTEHKANVTYEEMQAVFDGLGYENVFVGTVEGLPESTEVETVLAAVQDAGYTKVILRPLMVVAGDHANNDMADTEDEESWASIFGAALGADNVTCQIKGLGEIPAVQQVYVAHIAQAEKDGDLFPNVPDDATGVVKGTDGNWYYLKDGKIQHDYTGVQKNSNGWWYVEKGKVNFNYTGFGSNENGWWYVENGQVKFDKNDVIKGVANNEAGKAGEEGWWLVKGSKVAKETTVAKNSNGWWRIEDGQVNFKYNGVAKNANGWWYLKDGKVDFGYTGFGSNENGWWYVEKGQVKFDKNDVIKGVANNEAGKAGEEGWWLVRGSKVMKETTIAKNSNGWWYIENGKVNFKYTGLAKNEYGWWYLKDGKVDFSYTGFASNDNGWWYVEKGQLKFGRYDVLKGKANDLTTKAGIEGWWLVKDSKVSIETTVAKNSNGWWYIKNGKVDFTYNGPGTNTNGTWYIKNGKVDFSFNGKAYGYTFVNGKAK